MYESRIRTWIESSYHRYLKDLSINEHIDHILGERRVFSIIDLLNIYQEFLMVCDEKGLLQANKAILDIPVVNNTKSFNTCFVLDSKIENYYTGEPASLMLFNIEALKKGVFIEIYSHTLNIFEEGKFKFFYVYSCFQNYEGEYQSYLTLSAQHRQNRVFIPTSPQYISEHTASTELVHWIRANLGALLELNSIANLELEINTRLNSIIYLEGGYNFTKLLELFKEIIAVLDERDLLEELRPVVDIIIDHTNSIDYNYTAAESISNEFIFNAAQLKLVRYIDQPVHFFEEGYTRALKVYYEKGYALLLEYCCVERNPLLNQSIANQQYERKLCIKYCKRIIGNQLDRISAQT